MYTDGLDLGLGVRRVDLSMLSSRSPSITFRLNKSFNKSKRVQYQSIGFCTDEFEGITDVNNEGFIKSIFNFQIK